MTEFISEDDTRRIEEFTSVPRYQRSPEMLIPTEDSEEEE